MIHFFNFVVSRHTHHKIMLSSIPFISFRWVLNFWLSVSSAYMCVSTFSDSSYHLPGHYPGLTVFNRFRVIPKYFFVVSYIAYQGMFVVFRYIPINKLQPENFLMFPIFCNAVVLP